MKRNPEIRERDRERRIKQKKRLPSRTLKKKGGRGLLTEKKMKENQRNRERERERM